MDQTAAGPPPFIDTGLALCHTVFHDQFCYLRINTENKQEDVGDLSKAHGHEGGLLECCHLPPVNQECLCYHKGFASLSRIQNYIAIKAKGKVSWRRKSKYLFS